MDTKAKNEDWRLYCPYCGRGPGAHGRILYEDDEEDVYEEDDETLGHLKGEVECEGFIPSRDEVVVFATQTL